MTEEQLRKRVKHLSDDMEWSIQTRLDKAIASGAIKMEEYEDNYRLPKIVLVAILRDIEKDFTSPRKEDRKEVENIYKFI
jgi:hypothetical protein